MNGNQSDSADEEYDYSRCTEVGFATAQQKEIQNKIIMLKQNLTVEKLVAQYQLNQQIRDETELITALFTNLEVVQEMVTWMLNPTVQVDKQNCTIQHAKFVNSKVNQFLKDNAEFYEFMLIAAAHKVLPFDIWFRFLSEPCQTLDTSLGLCSEFFTPFIKYQFSNSSRVSEFEQEIGRSICPINLFSQEMIDRLISYSYHEAIFKLLFNLVLVSLQEEDWKTPLEILEKLFTQSIQKGKLKDSHAELMINMIKEIEHNIEEDKNQSVFVFINTIIEAQIFQACINRIESSPLCQPIKPPEIDPNEQQIVEFNLKVLQHAVKIYTKLMKRGIHEETHTMMNLYEQVKKIIHSLDSLIELVKNVKNRYTAFSNGQNVKIGTIYRYQFFYVLYQCIQLIKQKHKSNIHELDIDTAKLDLFEILKKYITMNRWNNIFQNLLEKIACLLLKLQCGTIKNQTVENFLQFLIESFNNKNFVFLNSNKMTTQGNIYSLYKISKKAAYYIESKMNFQNKLGYWRNFVVNNLQKYEVNQQKIQYKNQMGYYSDQDDEKKLKIDEVVTIKEIVKKIDKYNRWPIKQEKKSLKRSGSSGDLNLKKKKKQNNSQIKENQFSRQSYEVMSSSASEYPKERSSLKPWLNKIKKIQSSIIEQRQERSSSQKIESQSRQNEQ